MLGPKIKSRLREIPEPNCKLDAGHVEAEVNRVEPSQIEQSRAESR